MSYWCSSFIGVRSNRINKIMTTKKTFEETKLKEFREKFVVRMPYHFTEEITLDCLCSDSNHKDIITPSAKPDEIESFLTSALAEQKEMFRKEVENTRREIICAACDGAKCGHTLSCKLRNKILEILK